MTAPTSSPAAPATTLSLDVWSDVVCPWCYLGSRRLSTAINRFAVSHPDQRPTLRWRAYELDPRAPVEPRPMRPIIDAKYGPGAFESMTARLTALGEPEGIDYRFEQTLRVNTFDAHRLLAWAGSLDDANPPGADTDPTGAQGRLSEVLFHAYFTDGRDLAEHTTLVELCAGAGLDSDVAAEVLSSGSFGAEVRAEEAAASDRDITGVPATVVDGRLLVPGAQEVEIFLRVLERAAERAG